MAERLSPLNRALAITEQGGVPTLQFQTWWQQLISAAMTPGYLYPLAPRTVAEVALLTPTAGRMVFVTDESGGPVPAFGDGTSWRRVTDRAIVS